MVKRRIIPKLLLKDGRTVKGTRFEALRDTGNPVTNARIYDAQGADELLFLDITASSNKQILFDVIARTAQEVFMPFCAGGGVRSVDDVRELLRAGADKVAINSAAIEAPSLVSDAARIFGAQCVVVSVDYRVRDDGRAEVYTHGGTHATGVELFEHVRRMAGLGAGELLVTSIDRDGTMTGFDLERLERISASVTIPVIASGGAGTLQHLVDAAKAGVSGVAVGSLFHFTDQSPIKARAFMRVAGVDVRVGA